MNLEEIKKKDETNLAAEDKKMRTNEGALKGRASWPETRDAWKCVEPWFAQYSMLVSLSQILKTKENHPTLRCPQKYPDVPKKPPTLGSFWHFYNDDGHSNKEYQHF